MSLRSSLFIVLFACLLLGGCAALQPGHHSDRIDGYVVAALDGVNHPVPNAHITVRKSGNEEFLALASTTRSGHFGVAELFHFMSYEGQKLDRNQVYEVTIMAPEHFILKGELDFGNGAEQWTFTLRRKDDDLSEDGPVPIDDGPSGGTLSFGGSIRRTNR